jgi:hypothetical protein
MFDITADTCFTQNPDTSITWKSDEYFHPVTKLPMTVNIYESMECYELANGIDSEIFINHHTSDIEMRSILDYMAHTEYLLLLSKLIHHAE